MPLFIDFLGDGGIHSAQASTTGVSRTGGFGPAVGIPMAATAVRPCACAWPRRNATAGRAAIFVLRQLSNRLRTCAPLTFCIP
jgi:hypothetical protein